MAEAKQLRTLADMEAALAASARRPLLVFKHSTTCPISARAHREWQAFLETHEAETVTPAWVRVIEERPVSKALAERVGVGHKSPQALLIRSGQAIWSDSHRAITAQALRDAVQTPAGAGQA